MECDHLALSDLDRRLIAKAVADSTRVYLAPMDKGLSGSSVWQSRWTLPDGRLSKLHVFKIGPLRKLEAEERAIVDIASVIDHNFPLARLYRIEGEQRALLRQEFAGDTDGVTFSLRNYIRMPSYNADEEKVADVINRLYVVRMKTWHYGAGPTKTIKQSINEAVPWWQSKIDLRRVANTLGFRALNEELVALHGLSIDDLCRLVDAELRKERQLTIGPVHGDLHATNVNLDRNLQVYLIDFGNTMYTWRAIDFVILEAAIKVVAAPAHAPLNSLLACEELVDSAAPPTAIPDDSYYGSELRKILAAAVMIRQHCFRSSAEADINNYRAGLACVCAAFTSIEWMVNRRFLFHSIAHQLIRMDSGHGE